MPSAVHDLGLLEHIYDRQNLKLRTHVSVTISSPRLFEFPCSTNFESLEALVSSSTWVTGGNRLQLLVHLFFDEIAISDSDNSRVTEDLGLVLCNAEIWSQLGLDASLSLPGSDSHTSNHLQAISISLTRQTSSQPDADPPDGVPTACLKSIDLAMHFSTCRRRRVPVNDALIGNVVKQGTIEADLTYNRPGERLYLSLLSQEQSFRYVDDQRSRRPWELGFLADDNDRSLASNTTSSAETSPTSSQSSISSVSSRSSISDNLQSSRITTTHYSHATHDVRFEELVKVVDASMQTMISDHMATRNGSKGGSQPRDRPIVLSNDTGCPKLAAISPVLFSPGYHEVLSRHHPLLSTIAHIMCRVSHHTQSMNLRRKVEGLLDLSPDRYQAPDAADSNGEEHANSGLAAAIKARLWFSMRRKLVDPLASRKLKPLEASKRLFGPRLVSQDMLDELMVQNNNLEPLSRQEDTDLLAESQDLLMDDECYQADNLFDDAGLYEAEDMDDGLLMGGEIEFDDQGAVEELFWENLDIGEDTSYNSQAPFGDMFEQEPLQEEYHQLLDAGMEYTLVECTHAMHDEICAESQFEGIWRQDDMREDAEMGSVS